MGKTLLILSVVAAIFHIGSSDAYAYTKEAGEAAKLATEAATQSVSTVDKRVITLERYLNTVKSPMATSAETFVKEADEHQLDWRLVPAIAGLESSFGKRIPTNSYNPFGWGVFTGKSHGVVFEDWDDAISTVSKALKEQYVDKGFESIEEIGGRYAASPTWAPRIRFFMNLFENQSDTPSIDEISFSL